MIANLFNQPLRDVFENKLNFENLTEIRLRKNMPVVVFVENVPYYLCSTGLCTTVEKAICVTSTDIEDFVFKSCDFSIYTVNEQIKKGFIILENGIRIGLCGDCVFEGDKILTIKNFSSINIRIPRNVKGASLCYFDEIVSKTALRNTLIISVPGAGKTTALRDILFQISRHNYCLNVGVVDERGEIAAKGLDIGRCCDVVSFANKHMAFELLIRSMNPDLIVTDEIATEEDAHSLLYAANSGVCVVATIHANSIDQYKQKQIYSILKDGFFERYIVLSKNKGVGTIEGVYDSKFCRILKW